MTIRTLLNRKKVLDNWRNLWYNLSIKSGEQQVDILTIIEASSIDLENSHRVKQTIEEFGKTLKAVSEDKLPFLRTPVIAGGAVRDMIFGLTPKDYDIFFDISKLESEEVEDTCVLLSSMFLEDQTPNDPSRWTALPKGKDYGGAVDRWGKEGEFVVYEGYSNEDTTVQFIGHSNDLLDKSPITFAEDYFDWCLTKAVYDPLTETVQLGKDFLKALETEVIDGTESIFRISKWKDRYEQQNSLLGKRGGEFPFKIIMPPVSSQPYFSILPFS